LSGPNTVTISPVDNHYATVSGLTYGTYEFVYTLTSVYPTGNCPTTDTVVVINYERPSVSYAGQDQDLCLSGASVTTAMNANVPAVGIGTWTQVLGSPAVIADPLSSVTDITFSASGEYSFVWTISNGTCTPEYDYVHIKVSDAAIVDAGPDAQTCQDIPYTLSGAAATNYASIQWITSGTGTFSNPIAVNPVYYPSYADAVAGSVQLILFAEGVPPCVDVFDTMTLVVTHNPALVCNADIVEVTAPADCDVFVNVPLSNLTAGVNCVVDVYNNYNFTANASDTYPVGITPVEWAAVYQNGDTAYCTQLITVLGQPLAINDTVTTLEDTDISFDVLVNDLDCDNNLNPASITVTSNTSNGTLTVDPLTGIVTYSPDTNYFGNDQFTYQVCDSSNLCSSATVIINVTPVNDAPVVFDTLVNMPEDSTLVLCLPIYDVDGVAPYTVSYSGCYSNGVASFNVSTAPEVCLTYTPTPGFFGVDTVCFSLCDSDGDCDWVTVVINVIPDNPIIGLAKMASEPVLQSDDSYNVTYTLTVVNLGDATLEDVQVVDNLPTYNPAVITVVSTPSATGSLIANPLYDGYNDINLLATTGNTLLPGQSETITFTVNIVANNYFGPYENSALATGVDNSMETASDISNDGLHADPNNNGIADEEGENEITVVMLEPTLLLFIPEGFSPNGDGINDFFVIPGIEDFPNCELTIFNRWGNPVYKATGYDNTWDGKPNVGGFIINDEKVLPGTYYYVLEYNRNDRNPEKGFIVIQY